MLTGDLGRTAELARDGQLATAELALFRPLKSMLASPVADEAEALARMAPPVWVEDKYDGIRAQLHKLGDEVRLYSRDLNDVSERLPGSGRGGRGGSRGTASSTARCWPGATAWRCRSSQLQARLGRKEPIEQMQARCR